MPNFLQENNYMLNDLAAHGQREQRPGPVAHAAHTTDFSFTFTTQNGTRLLLHAVADGILRFRYLPPGAPAEPDFSYALPGPDEPYPTRPALPTALEFREEADHYRLATAQLVCLVEKAALRTRVLDHVGQLLSADEQGFSWRYDDDTGNDHVQLSHRVPAGAAYYGLGDKPTSLNLRGQRLVNWGSDTYGYEYGRDPLYKNIPFYYVLHQGRAHGIFFDNTFKTHFDFATARPDATSFGAEGGELNYYFIDGPALLDVAEAYTCLTGPPPLPPLWALGYHQCKWSYFPESNLREITQGLRARRIPCDAVYLDIDYMDGYRCFTWHPEHFPEPRRLVRELAEDGFKLVVIIDPGIKIDPNYAVYQEGVENDYFCRRADGPLLRGSVWPGPCHFPDYTRPEVRAWWASLFEGLIQDVGVRGIWTDMNEPAVFERGTFPDDVRFGYDGQPGSHRKAHNIYGMQMARATAAGAARFGHPRRPFAITRSTYAGGQRHACVWTGDNVATWEHLALANVQCQRLSISGFSFAGSDIGGFIGTPSGELYARWVALGAFHPFFRTHSSGDHGDQEPWSFGEPYTSRARQFIELRYQLLPYVYTAFWQYSTRGTPMLRPLTFLDQHDPETYLRQAEFGFGDSLLVCPVTQAGAEGRWLYLPKGEWYYYWDDAPTAGGREVWAAADLTRIPLYVRAGAVLPMQPIMQYVGEKPVDELTLHVYYKNGTHESVLYDDGGEGYGYQRGHQTVRRFTVVGDGKSLLVSQKIEGDYQPGYATYRVVVHGLPAVIGAATADAQPLLLAEYPVTETTVAAPAVIVDVRFGEVQLMLGVLPESEVKGN